MLIAYDSRTGHVGKFVKKLNLPAVRIDEALEVDAPFVLVTYTTGMGQAPGKVLHFLQKNRNYLRGVAASGNRNWGEHFAGSADRVSELFGVPVLCKFELSGTERDVERFLTEVRAVASY
ncbi:class Ib ribonucleoside-diphosphate reductase assembly flavoprotein NrdI [Gorillibacterium sp. sgz5001074]|uniref:class Ib ribonucleoside-diphosphate reductase assembly flavoprotein NrdI n=1 Tax=Gorillibacterium sp. sgz5001074 TaxID=3446695 RepID=UPI003F67E26F